MASFETHLSVGCALSGLAATGLFVTGIASPEEVILYFAMGSIGSLLPDIDSDHSIPVRITFSLLAITIAFLVVFSQGPGYSLAETLVIWLVSFILFKHLIFAFFSRFTVHRGLVHSIPAAFLFWFMGTIFLHKVFHLSSFRAWMAGFFIFFGFITHLVLDELNSLNLPGRQVKKSFGTALKIGDQSDLKNTAVLYVAVIILFYLTPDEKQFFQTALSRETYGNVQLLPEGTWFHNLGNKN